MEDLKRKRVEEREAKRLKKLQQLSKNNYKVGDVFQYKTASRIAILMVVLSVSPWTQSKLLSANQEKSWMCL